MLELTLYQIADVIEEGGNHFRKIRMKGGENLINIGRRECGSIAYRHIESFLDKKVISRLHACIQKIDDKFYLTDLSRYGTYVNHRRIKKTIRLKPHDLVFFGHPGGDEIRPGDPICQYYWDLKYVVMIEHSRQEDSEQESELWQIVHDCFDTIRDPNYLVRDLGYSST